jgi:hypothetical protein
VQKSFLQVRLHVRFCVRFRVRDLCLYLFFLTCHISCTESEWRTGGGGRPCWSGPVSTAACSASRRSRSRQTGTRSAPTRPDRRRTWTAGSSRCSSRTSRRLGRHKGTTDVAERGRRRRSDLSFSFLFLLFFCFVEEANLVFTPFCLCFFLSLVSDSLRCSRTLGRGRARRCLVSVRRSVRPSARVPAADCRVPIAECRP